jgi:CTP synthase
MLVSGRNPRRDLVEIIELRDHPWFLAVQFHPEFQSKPSAAHPLFAAFVGAALRYRRAKQEAVAQAQAGQRAAKVAGRKAKARK